MKVDGQRWHPYGIHPSSLQRPSSVRGKYLYNVVDCLHTCILRRDLPRARRAWAILIRCPDLNWRDRWNWGLFLLNAKDNVGPASRSRAGTEGDEGESDAEVATNPYSQPLQARSSFRDPEQATLDYIRSIRLAVKEEYKPGVLVEAVLHLISCGRYRDARSELTTYLLDYPYTLSAQLHTYAGMICFYLAQPEPLQGGNQKPRRIKLKVPTPKPPPGPPPRKGRPSLDNRTRSEPRGRGRQASEESESESGSDFDDANAPPPNDHLIREARDWFAKALKIDPTEAVAQGFLDLIDKPARMSDDEMDLDDDSSDHAPRGLSEAPSADAWRDDLDHDMSSPPSQRGAGHGHGQYNSNDDDQDDQDDQDDEDSVDARARGQRSGSESESEDERVHGQ